jgi:hypothetical protein
MTDKQQQTISSQHQQQFQQSNLSGDIKRTTFTASDLQAQANANLQTSEVRTIEKKVITETVPEVHYETRYIEQKVPVAKAVTTQKEVVTAVQETKEIPVTKFVEQTERVPVKRVEQVTETKTVPVTRLEEVTENIPVKKVIAHTEYQKVPVTRLQEKTEYVDVKKTVPVTEYQTVTVTTPVNPQVSGNINASASMTQQTCTTSSNLQGQNNCNLKK